MSVPPGNKNGHGRIDMKVDKSGSLFVALIQSIASLGISLQLVDNLPIDVCWCAEIQQS